MFCLLFSGTYKNKHFSKEKEQEHSIMKSVDTQNGYCDLDDLFSLVRHAWDTIVTESDEAFLRLYRKLLTLQKEKKKIHK